MKKLLFLGVGSALMFTMGGIGSAQADNGPHSIVQGQWSATANFTSNVSTEGATQCANCHRAHTAKTDKLTLLAQPLLCLNCHDNNGSTLNVVQGVNDTTQAALRGGGFVNAKIDSGPGVVGAGGVVVGGATKTLSTTGSRFSAQIGVLSAGAPVTSSHQINGTTTGTMWGNGTDGAGQTGVTLECGACHDPHGNGNYRILKPSPDGQQYITSLPGVTPVTMSAKTAVNIPDQPAKVYTTTNYWDVQAVGVPLNAVQNAQNGIKAGTVTDGFLGGISAWCTTCHTRYLSSGASTSSGDQIFTYKHRSDEQANYKPDCIQCHVAHGTNAVMTGYALGVTAPDGTVTGTGTITATGTSAPLNGLLASGYQNSSLLRVNDRGTCLMCHAVGGPNPLSPVAP